MSGMLSGQSFLPSEAARCMLILILSDGSENSYLDRVKVTFAEQTEGKCFINSHVHFRLES
jgi:hypothetical protein